MFFGDKKLLALDIGTSSIKLAEIEFTRKGPSLRRFAVQSLPVNAVSGGEIVDVTAVSQIISDLVRVAGAKRRMVVTGMWGTSVVVKKIAMPRMEESLVAEQIKWEAEQYIPFDVNEVTLDHHILRESPSGSESMEVLLVAAKQEFVFRFIEAVESAGLKCAILDVSGFALANCFEINYGTNPAPVALLNFGAGVTNFVVVQSGEVIFSRDISSGGSVFTADIQKAMGVSMQEAEALKISASVGQEVPDEVNSIIAATNEQVVDEVRSGFDFFAATSNGVPLSKVYVSGGSVFVPGLVEQVSKGVELPFEFMDPFLRVAYDSKIFTLDYIEQIKAICPVAIGLGLRKLSDG